MKILQLIQKAQLRGAEIFAAQLSEHLLTLQQECKMVILLKGDAVLPFSGQIIELNRPLNKRFWDWAGWKQFADIISSEKPDIIQANAGDTLKFAVLSKLLFGWKAPIVFRNASMISSYIRFPWVEWFNRFLFRNVSSVLSVSQFTAKDFVFLFPFMKNKVSVIPVGIELTENASAQTVSGYLLHVGGFTFEKNHEGLLRIMKNLARQNPTLELWLVGDGPLRPRVEKRVKELGLNDKVRFLGYQNSVWSYMKSAKALLLPSIIEGLPGVILEAMFCRTPVVAYAVGGVSEVITQGETGWLVKAADEEGFTAATQEVLQASSLDTLKNHAYNLVVNDYDNRKIAKRFLESYQKIVSGSL